MLRHQALFQGSVLVSLTGAAEYMIRIVPLANALTVPVGQWLWGRREVHIRWTLEVMRL